MAGITASQPVQWSYMAFCLASVFFIVQAYVGAVYMLESHLRLACHTTSTRWLIIGLAA